MYLGLSWVYSQASFLWESHFTESPGGRTSLANFDKKGGILGYCFRYLRDDWSFGHRWQLCRLTRLCMIHVFWFFQDGFRWIHSCRFHGPIPTAHFFSFISSPDFTNIFVVPYPLSPPISIMFSFSVHCPSHWLRHQSCAERCLQASSKPGRSHQRSWWNTNRQTHGI